MAVPPVGDGGGEGMAGIQYETIGMIAWQIAQERDDLAAQFSEDWSKVATQLQTMRSELFEAANSVGNWSSPVAEEAFQSRATELWLMLVFSVARASNVSSALSSLATVMTSGKSKMKALHDEYESTMARWDVAYQQDLADLNDPYTINYDPWGRTYDIEWESSVGGPAAPGNRAGFVELWNAEARRLRGEIASSYAPMLGTLSGVVMPGVDEIPYRPHPGAFGLDLPAPGGAPGAPGAPAPGAPAPPGSPGGSPSLLTGPGAPAPATPTPMPVTGAPLAPLAPAGLVPAGLAPAAPAGPGLGLVGGGAAPVAPGGAPLAPLAPAAAAPLAPFAPTPGAAPTAPGVGGGAPGQPSAPVAPGQRTAPGAPGFGSAAETAPQPPGSIITSPAGPQLVGGAPGAPFVPPAGPPAAGMAPPGVGLSPGMGLPGMSMPPGMAGPSGMTGPPGMTMPPGMARPPGMGTPPGMARPPGMGTPPGMARPPGSPMGPTPPQRDRSRRAGEQSAGPSAPPPGQLVPPGTPAGPGAPGMPGRPGTPGMPGMPGAPGSGGRQPDARQPGGATVPPATREEFQPPAAPPPVLGDPQQRRGRPRAGSRSEAPPAMLRPVRRPGTPAGTSPVLANQRHARRLTFTEQRENRLRERREHAARQQQQSQSAFAEGLAGGTDPVLRGRIAPVEYTGPDRASEVPAWLRTPATAEQVSAGAGETRAEPADRTTRRFPPAERPAEQTVWEVETPGGPVVEAEAPRRRVVEPRPSLGTG